MANDFLLNIEKIFKTNELTQIDNVVTIIRIASYQNYPRADKINKTAFWLKRQNLPFFIWATGKAPLPYWHWPKLIKKEKTEDNETYDELVTAIKLHYKWGDRDFKAAKHLLDFQYEAERIGFTDRQLKQCGLKQRDFEPKKIAEIAALEKWF